MFDIYPADTPHCAGSTCAFIGRKGRDVLFALRRGIALQLEIDESRAYPVRLVWPLWNIDAMLDDFAVRRAGPGLP